jgi:virginiamycin B lyase
MSRSVRRSGITAGEREFTRPRRAWQFVAAAAVAVALTLAAWSASAQAALTGTITNVAGSASAFDVAAGTDGNVWFTLHTNSTSGIGRVTPSGTLTIFAQANGLHLNSSPAYITAGADGNMWFTDRYTAAPAIGKITPSGQITEYSISNGNSSPSYIVAGADGNIWFADGGTPKQVGKITPAGTITEYPLPAGAGAPTSLAASPNGNIWLTTTGSTGVVLLAAGSSTPVGFTQTNYGTGNAAESIAAAPTGDMWLTAAGGTTPAIYSITPTGTIFTAYTSGLDTSGGGTPDPQSIVEGPDGDMWFADDGGNVTEALGRITPSGVITEYTAGLFLGSSNPEDLTVGPDGNIWFLDDGAEEVGEVNPDGEITEYSEPPIGPSDTITPAADGNIWFTYGNAAGVANIITGAPAASLLSPAVAGGGQAGIPQVCEGAQWSDFAFQQPETSLFGLDGFSWYLNGSLVAGQTTASFTPTSLEVGDTIACHETVTYPLTGVTAVGTSAPVTVISQNSGPAGPAGSNGSNGSNGAQGPAGAAGPAGAQGAAGEVDLVTCTTVKMKKKCTSRLTSSPVSFTTHAARATLSRAGHVYATGRLRDGKLTLHAPTSLRIGRYTLKLTTGSGRHKHTTTEKVTVGRSITIS